MERMSIDQIKSAADPVATCADSPLEDLLLPLQWEP